MNSLYLILIASLLTTISCKHPLDQTIYPSEYQIVDSASHFLAVPELNIVGTTIKTTTNEYLVVKHLDDGAFGSVYLAEDKFSQEYALKLIKPPIKPFKQKMFDREINILIYINETLDLNQVPDINDSSRHHLGLLVEFSKITLQGEKFTNSLLVFNYYPLDFKSLINCKTVSLDYKLFLIIDLIHALNTLHSTEVAHLDIKPSNIAISKEMRAVLIDFGLSEHAKPLTGLDRTAGSLMYMAPEILHKEEYGFQADVWSLGTVFYQLLTGEPFFNVKVLEDLYKELLSINATLNNRLDKINPWFFEVISRETFKKMFSVNPVYRITMKEFARYVEQPEVTMKIQFIHKEMKETQSFNYNYLLKHCKKQH